MINKRHTVSGLNSAHGLRRAGKNGLLARHNGLLRPGETGPTWPGGQPAARVPRAGRGGASARDSPVDGAWQGAQLQHHR
jgi:hypothetical protein